MSATAAFAWTNVCSDTVKMIAAHQPSFSPPSRIPQAKITIAVSAAAMADGNSFVKRHAVFYWLIGIAIAATAVALSFHFDSSVRDFMAQHQSRVMRDFMRYVSLFGDWPSHIALGLILLGIAWIRDSKKWM